MSSFFVGNNSLSKLANSLMANFYKDFVDFGVPIRLYEALYDLNIEALKSRYEDWEVLVYEEKNYLLTAGVWQIESNFITDENREYLLKNLAQFYMSLECFLYQCCEGEIPEKSELYKKLEEISDILAHRLASEYAEKLGAKWE